MFSHFFIERPIFASVLSIVIALAGAVAAFNLPVAQYPPITPPSIIVSCTYPGADARVVADSVAAPIEQQVNGVEGMMYMVSQSNNDGSYTLTVTFRPGINLNFAQVLVQNRVNLALPQLPDVVKQTGVLTRKRNPDILQVMAIYSPHNTYDAVYLSNYTTIQIKDEIARVDGVGDCQQFGQQDHSLRIWVDPDKLAVRNLTALDVANAVTEQNRQVAAGYFGARGGNSFLSNLRDLGKDTTTPAGQEASEQGLAKSAAPVAGGTKDVGAWTPPFQYPITMLGRLSEPDQFDKIIVRIDSEGRRVRVKDIGEAQLGIRSQDSFSKVDGRPNASLAVWALADANSVATAQRVRDKMEELKRNFPEDMDYTVSLDMTPFIVESIHEVFRTLVEAIILVALVVLVFLQNWRSALIPLAAVPVAIIGTFAVMAAIGFSINTLTLFGLVLAVGIVVDDAIVVVEAIEHHIETGLSPRAAAHKAMEQVSGPVVAVALVLSAVFVPCAFIGGITGMFFRQFALTIAVSTIISAFNSLTLSPALAALLLQPRGARKDIVGRAVDLGLGWFFRLFNWGFTRTTNAYTRLVGLAMRGSVFVLVVYGGLVLLTGWCFESLPAGYVPNQDQGRFYIAVQLPDAASLERTQAVVDRVTQIVKPMRGVRHVTGIAGQSFTLNANGSNFGQFFVAFDNFDKRQGPSMSASAITDRVRAVLATEVPEAKISLYTPPPISGLGSASGFKIIIEDRGDLGLSELQKQVERVVEAGNDGHFKLTESSFEQMRAGADAVTDEVLTRLQELKDREYLTKGLFERAINDALGDVGIRDEEERSRIRRRALQVAENRKFVSKLFSIFRAEVPQLYADIDRAQCQTMGVNPQDVFDTLQIYLGSLYVNDFNRFGRTWQVIVQARGAFRNKPEKVAQLKVRNNRGNMVPLGAVLTMREVGGPINIGRYNMYPAAAILGATEPGVSSGEGIDEMERVCAAVLPPGMKFEWTEINYMQVDASKNFWNKLIFPLAVMFVFLVLAAQYESWALPLAVILVVPMCILGSLGGVWLSRYAHEHTFVPIWSWISRITTDSPDINIFTQIGFVVLVGLASKNAILIVEFAKHKHEEGGLSRREAALEACRLRIRPILMTSFAFILGVIPLLVTTGAGAEMRRTLGTAVFSGMLGVTLFGIFLTPVFFFVIEAIAEGKLFSSQRAQQVGTALRWTVDILSAGLFYLATLLGRELRKSSDVAERVSGESKTVGKNSVNGNGVSPHNGKVVDVRPDGTDGKSVSPQRKQGI